MCFQSVRDVRITSAGILVLSGREPAGRQNENKHQPESTVTSQVQHSVRGRGFRKESGLPLEADKSICRVCIFSQPVRLPNVSFPQSAPHPQFYM